MEDSVPNSNLTPLISLPSPVLSMSHALLSDDLEVAPDFFEYFKGTLGLLREDSSLWCVSAWNDNGKAKRINETGAEILYRTDFFPGLGWMLTKETWNELSPKWPPGYDLFSIHIHTSQHTNTLSLVIVTVVIYSLLSLSFYSSTQIGFGTIG